MNPSVVVWAGMTCALILIAPASVTDATRTSILADSRTDDMIDLKAGVKPLKLTPQILFAMAIAETVYSAAGYPTVTVTSLGERESRHKDGSKHYTGEAVDLRLNHIAEAGKRAWIAERLTLRLAPAGYDVLHEYHGTTREHLHVEWDLHGK